ncbi:MAG: hypothetical protein AVDCRST_MAG11-757 [uncultured Gemmatimonadaceae bacterium]|uniref:DUF4097 domain-containing protein n=1 Tax=uncultured Gemmatimonadaceae bacterium TaxID=246130 RepID=A0A6J4KAZ9_9BACT|nr:MAG: hypothetical protein AVDCRST_MAG11-757 [uncultured Gemmatimonadaceae bacterium]
MRTLAYVAAALLATAFVVRRGLADSDGDHTAPRNAAIDAAGATLLRLESGAGELRVVAVDGASQVRVQGVAHASRASGLAGVKLELRRDGRTVRVRPVLAAGGRRWWFGGPTRRALDMIVEVPRGMEADVTDGAGDVEVQGVSALRVKDGSGELRVSDVHGPVRVADGSGDLELSAVHGDVWVDDGSGDVSVRDVEGAVVVNADGSGELVAAGVGGDMLVRDDGSGDIDVSNVGGRLIVTRDQSGEVRHHDVRGGVQVPAKARRE